MMSRKAAKVIALILAVLMALSACYVLIYVLAAK